MRPYFHVATVRRTGGLRDRNESVRRRDRNKIAREYRPKELKRTLAFEGERGILDIPLIDSGE